MNNFRYTRNLANRLGFIYSDRERALDTATPLFTLFLAAINCLSLDIILIGKSVNLLAEAATAALIYTILRQIGSRGLAWAGDRSEATLINHPRRLSPSSPIIGRISAYLFVDDPPFGVFLPLVHH